MTRRTSRRRSRGASTSVGATVIILLLAGLVFLFNRVTGSDPAATPTSPAETVLSDDWYHLYFTAPKNPDTPADHHSGIDELVVESVNAARQTIDLAGYEINLASVADALAAAHGRGVRVRVVTDSDNLEEEAITVIERAGIPFVGDRREALMHDKFMVVDGATVWTGSMNFTVNDVYRNNNNFIQIQSTRIALNYTQEFEEMFSEDRFGPSSPADTPAPSATINGTPLEVMFSPEDNPARRIIELIRQARTSIYFMAFSFTSDEIADAMLERAAAGVKLQGLFEESQYNSNQGTEYDRLRQSPNVEVRLDGNRYNLHHKVIVIDGTIVITGSYNFSRAAEESNDENVLILHNAEIAAQYLVEFVKLFEMGR